MDNQPEKDAALVTQFWVAPDEALFGQSVVAPVLDKSQAWCERARICGGGPRFIKLGRNVVYRKSDVVVWVNGHKPVNSTSEYSQAQAA